jgi:hypothetical protein
VKALRWIISILKPPFHGLRADAHQMTQFAKRQTLLFTKRGDMADAASRITGNVVDGPEAVLGGGFKAR